MYITFDSPQYLWFLLTIPIFIITHFWFLKRSRGKAIKFANFETLKRISGEKLLTKNMTHLVIRIIIMFCLIITASGANLWVKGLSNQTNFVMAIDSSASMTSEDVAPTRFDAAKTYMNDFVDNLDSQTKLGLVSFAGATIVESPLTDSRADFKLALHNTKISRTGGTDVPGAIITATNLLLAEPNEGKSILMVSDGVNTIGAFLSDSIDEAIKYAKKNRVIINTIGLGTNSGPLGYLPEYYNISSSYDAGLLQKLANETGGQYIYAASANDLVQAYALMNKHSDEKYINFNLSYTALIIALSLLFLEWGLANTVYRRVV